MVLLPSPSAASPGAAMRPSSRYGAGPEAGGGGHVLDRSTVSAIAALNPTAPAAQEAAVRLQHYGGATAAALQREAAGPRSSTAPVSASTAAMGDVDATFASYLGASPSASAAGRQHQAGLRGGLGGSTASGPGSDAAAMRSLVSLSTASPGGSPGLGGMGAVTGSMAAGSRRPPLAPRASGAVASSSAMGAYGSPPHGSGLGAAAHGSLVRAGAAGDEEEDNAYEDEEFEEYEGSDGEGGGKGHGDEDDEDNPAALLRQSVHALHGLVQMKIKQVRHSVPISSILHVCIVRLLGTCTRSFARKRSPDGTCSTGGAGSQPGRQPGPGWSPPVAGLSRRSGRPRRRDDGLYGAGGRRRGRRRRARR